MRQTRRAAKQGADKHLDVLRGRVADIVAMVDAIVDRFPTA